MEKIARREFLKAAPAAASAAYAAAVEAGSRVSPAEAGAPPVSDTRISSAAYTAIPEYPIQPVRHTEVAIGDEFWKPKILANATVTIPFEVEKLAATPEGLGGNVLEAAILSLAAHPDARLQAQVDARVAQIAAAPARGNSGFEVAAAWYRMTGKRDLLERAIVAADAL